MSKISGGFSLAETLTTLSIIGILCITMLSLNSMSDNKYKIATTKLSQVDSALKSWGKAISKTNETGVGVAGVITNQEKLSASLSDYFNTLSNTSLDKGLSTSQNSTYSTSSNEMVLNNGVKLTFAYNENNENALNNAAYIKDENASPLAVITAEIKDLPNTKEEYIVKANGLYDIATIYEGYTETKVETITAKDENGEEITKRVYCTNSSCNSENGGCQKNPSACMDAPSEGNTIYVDDNGAQTVSCGYNQTGTIKTVKIADAYGVYTTTVNTCCSAPKTCIAAECGDKNTSSCSCNSFVASAGYIKANNDSCQKLADEGSYSKGGNVEKVTLCGMGDEYAPKEKGETRKGYYCPNKGMTGSILCPKGSYCPDYADNTDKNKNEEYHPEVYADENNILQGGLINKVICPKGSVCPDEGMKKDTPCPKGSYCPNEGMTEAIMCPKGTYGDKEGAKTKEEACKPCPAGNYCPNEGMADTDLANFICNKDEGEYSLEGAIACSVCPAGQYLDKKETICKPCAAGHYSPSAGAISCSLCPEGTIQPKIGQVSCITCTTGTSTPDRLICGCSKGEYLKKTVSGKSTTYSCAPCPAGTYTDEPNILSECKICKDGTYQNETGQTGCKNCPEHSIVKTNSDGFPVDASNKVIKPIQISLCKCVAGYGTNASGTLLNGSNSCNLVGENKYSPDNDNKIYSCPSTSITDGALGSDSINACKCPAGKYGTNLDGENLRNTSSCANCPANKYKEISGNLQNLCLSCSDIDANTTSPAGSVSMSACKCKAGYALYDNNYKYDGSYFTKGNKNTVSCQLADCAYYSPANDNTVYYCGNALNNPRNGITAETLLKNTVVNTAKLSSAVKTKYGNDFVKDWLYGPKGQTASSQCKYKTATQRFTDSNSVNHCAVKTCNANATLSSEEFAIGDSTTPRIYTKCICNLGYYGDGDTCTKCPAGTYAAIPGLTDVSQCTPCPTGTYQNETGKTSCKSCSCGEYQDKEGQSSCKSCPNNQYQNKTGQTSCINVKAGQKPTANKCDYQKSCPTLDYYGTYEMIATHDSCSCPTMHWAGPWPWCFDGYGYSSVTSSDGKYTCTATYQRCEPLILDLKGSDCGSNGKCIGDPTKDDCCKLKGIKMTSLEDGVIFDLDGDGKKDKTSWTDFQTEFDDAFLVLDKNGNGQIDDGHELFGDQNGASDGIKELSKYDDNGDGIITKDDTIFDELMLWVDFNKNGEVDYDFWGRTKELRKLSDVGIIELSTEGRINYDENGEVVRDEYGNTYGLISNFKRLLENGMEVLGEMIDVFFRVIYSIFEK